MILVTGATGIVHTACTFTDSMVDIAAMEALIDGWRSIERKVQSSDTGPFSPSNVPFVYFSSLDVYGPSTMSHSCIRP